MLTSDIRPHLDHVFVTIDPGLIRAIAGTPYFAEGIFGRFFEKNATSTLLGPYRTTNIVGRNTCVELFPADAPPFPGVRLGIVMSFDKVGESPLARSRLDALGIAYHHELIRRMVPGHDEPQPWYHLVRPDFGEGSPFTLFLSEITPEYFDRLGAIRSPDGSQGRDAYLEAALKSPHLDRHIFDDVRHVRLRLSPVRAELLERILGALGYEGARRDGVLHLDGPGVTLEVFHEGDGPEGLVELGLDLSRPETESPGAFRFGEGCEIVLSPSGLADRSAVWRFEPARAA